MGLGQELELATLTTALAGARSLPPGGYLSLNVSPGLVLDGDRLAHALAGADRPLVIEITEHERIDDYAALRAALERLRPEVRVAVDDAGAGVANLHHLVELRPSLIKLDMRLVRAVETDLTRQAMIVGLLHFARTLGGWVVAEGIETEAERDKLWSIGVALGQGFLFGRPAEAGSWTRPTRQHGTGPR